MISNLNNLPKKERKSKHIKMLKENAEDTSFEEIVPEQTKVVEDLLKKGNEKKIKTEKEGGENKDILETQKKKEFFERVKNFNEKEKLYQEERIRLENLLQKLEGELKLSKEKDKEEYLASLEKKKTSLENTAEVEIKKEEVVNTEKIPENNETSNKPASIDINKTIEEIPEIKKKKTNSKEKIRNYIDKTGRAIGSGLSYLIDDVFEIQKEKTPENNKLLSNIDETPTPKDVETPIENAGNVDKVIEKIPKKEKKIIEKAMEEDTPMEFESPKVKTNYKDFIKNNVVKLVSGFKISSKIKNIIERNTKNILRTTAILILWTSGNSFVKPSNVEGDVFLLKRKEVLDIVNKTLEISDVETYNKLSENGKRIYLYASSKIEGSYVIVDKPSATLYMIGADKKLIGQMPVLLGQTKGETPNMSDPESDTAVQATTPAGKYTMGTIIGEEDLITYKGKVFSLCGSDALALHITYPPEKEKRTEALNTPTPEDNRLSWGCLNISEEMWAKYIEGNIENRGTYMFITPDNPIMSLNPETGQIEKGNYNFLAMNNINN